VLPSGVKQTLVTELDKRLDLDIDNIMDSPKLRLELSPAELDKRLLELYESLLAGPRGDVLRIILGGGGQDVALQNFYMKRHAARERAKEATNQTNVSFGPFEIDGGADANAQTASQWVQRALKRNLPKSSIPISPSKSDEQPVRPQGDEDNTKMKMSISHSAFGNPRSRSLCVTIPSSGAKRFCPPRRSASFSLLI
jgi:hypothetical protein